MVPNVVWSTETHALYDTESTHSFSNPATNTFFRCDIPHFDHSDCRYLQLIRCYHTVHKYSNASNKLGGLVCTAGWQVCVCKWRPHPHHTYASPHIRLSTLIASAGTAGISALSVLVLFSSMGYVNKKKTITAYKLWVVLAFVQMSRCSGPCWNRSLPHFVHNPSFLLIITILYSIRMMMSRWHGQIHQSIPHLYKIKCGTEDVTVL